MYELDRHRGTGLWVILGLLICLSSCKPGDPVSTDQQPIYTKLDSKKTGIKFSNDLVPNVATKENLLDFDYFYNGAGVGIGDINNDGYPDLFFAGNQSENKLYINKGNFQFDDISDSAGINNGKYWSNGVTFADINEDGWLDIYISQGGPHIAAQRKNLLYINNGDLTFDEKAEDLGLADQGISTQSAFFDYDKDGDMDCIVMNESILYGHDPITFHRLLLENQNEVYVSYTHLYRNDNGVYSDVTIESEIDAPTFGLGLVISDINRDGWLDILIANDYYQPDNVYINKKNGSFSDRSGNHLLQTAFFGMGADIADINNDTHQDMFILDMASKDHIRSKTLMASMNVDNFNLLVDKFGFIHQYMFNALQLNTGRNVFHNVAQMAGVAKTDWSWSVLMEDFDHDGYRDIFVTNGYRKYGTDNDFKSKVTSAKMDYDNDVPLDIKKQLYDEIPSEQLANYMFRQSSDLKFEEVQDSWGLEEVSFSNGAAFGDLDLDGDLDLVINNIDQEAFLYESSASSQGNYLNVLIEGNKQMFAEVKIFYGDQIQISEIRRVRGYMSSVQPMSHFGLGKVDRIDSLHMRLADGRLLKKYNLAANQNLSFDTKDFQLFPYRGSVSKNPLKSLSPLAYGIEYRHVENEFNDFEKEILLPYKQSTRGPCIAVGDVNKDGVDDFYLGGSSGQAGRIYRSTGRRYELLAVNDFETDKIHEDAAAHFIDLDLDDDLDLIVLSGGNEWNKVSENYRDRVYLQIENGAFVTANNQSAYMSETYSGGVVKTLDFDKDGDVDLFVGNRIIPQSYPVAAPSFLYENRNGQLINVTQDRAPELLNAGIVNDTEIIDLNDDGWEDIFVVGEWESPLILINKNGQFEAKRLPDDYRGLWMSVTSIDIDLDGDKDFILGNIGENFKLEASQETPLYVYAGDIDNNGTHDLILSSEYKGEYVPVRGKECSSQQLPFLNKKYSSYEEFASASLIDIYGQEELSNAYRKSISTTSSILLINNGDMEFSAQDLPKAAQAFPLIAAVQLDTDEDGDLDLIAMGTIYNMEVETPRLDAGSGILLVNDGKQLVYSKEISNSIFIPGNIKSSEIIKSKNGKDMLVVGRNNSVLALFEI